MIYFFTFVVFMVIFINAQTEVSVRVNINVNITSIQPLMFNSGLFEQLITA